VPLAPRSVVIYAITGIILLSLGLRTGVAALSPLATLIDLDIVLVGLPLGALGTIPPIAYALAASVSPFIARRIGLEWAAIAMSILGAAAHVWRGISPNYASLFVATVVLMFAAGVGNVILPGLVKLYAPRAIGAVTAAYTTAMALSSSAPAVLGFWLADAFGWRISLVSWAVVSVAGAIPWLLVIPFAKARGLVEAEINASLPLRAPTGSLWKSPTAVSIMAIFSVAGVSAYTWFAVLPVIISDISDLSVAEAATSLGLFAIIGLPLSLTIPPLAIRPGVAPKLVAAAMIFGLIGIGGLLFFPTAAPFVWVVFLGLAPLPFHLSLTLIAARTRDHVTALELSGFVNTVGYSVAAAGPLVVGLLFQLTGNWTMGLVFLAVTVAAQAPAIWVLARENFIEDEVSQSQ
jgi:MFS transporter, CP family, cyanate transporter